MTDGVPGPGAECRCTRRLEKHLMFCRLFKRALVGPRKEDRLVLPLLTRTVSSDAALPLGRSRTQSVHM